MTDYKLIEAPKKYRAIVIKQPIYGKPILRNKWKTIWGSDIWFGKVPFCKSLFAANLAVWFILAFAR